MSNSKIYLKKGRESSLERFHPWVFSGAIAKIDGTPSEGDVVDVYSYNSTFLGRGHYQIGSITVRVLTFENESIDLSFWKKRIQSALDLRVSYIGLNSNTNCYRLVHGEGDNLAGLIIDYYNGVAVIQAHSAGMFNGRLEICQALRDVYKESLMAVYDKSSSTAPFKAGLDLKEGYLYRNPDFNDKIEVSENGVLFKIDFIGGQKTGFFLDQRDNRDLLKTLSKDKDILNLFCYTGGFSIYALKGGAKSVISVDSSSAAIDGLERNIQLNRERESICEPIIHKSVCADAIEYLKNIPHDAFDIIVVDPPAFAKHRDALKNALRAYQRLNYHAISKVKKGGYVFTYSCSQVVDKTLFTQAIFSAAAQTKRAIRIVGRLTQPADHPVNIFHPEGEYLKGLLLYIE